MKTGFRGAFVISWRQSDIDGRPAGATDALCVGSTWRWGGNAVRIDGPNEVLSLGTAVGAEELHRRAARRVRQLVGTARSSAEFAAHDEIPDEPLLESGFTVTDGRRSYALTVISVADGTPPLLMMLDDLPPRDTDLWVVHCDLSGLVKPAMVKSSAGMICFTPGVRLQTPTGPVPVEALREGDLLETRDSGVCEIRWIGERWMSGARLYAMPWLRPVCIRAGALGGEPDADLIVSPDHRVLIRGPQAQALFNTPEVLVAARDLLNDRSITLAHGLREVRYIHIALDSHQIIWANGVETETFHPASCDFDMLTRGQRMRLYEVFSDIADDPHAYGAFARRNLTQSEAAILCSDIGARH